MEGAIECWALPPSPSSDFGWSRPATPCAANPVMPFDPTPVLTPAQRRVVGVALTFGAAVAIVALIGVVFMALGRFLAAFSGVIWPIATLGRSSL